LYEKFAAFQFAILDREQGVISGFANSVPLRWDGTLQELPDDGWDWALSESARQYADDIAANMLCGIQISVSPEYQGQGLSTLLLREMTALARRHGLSQVIVPVRPSMKSRYPLTPIDRYIEWHRDDELPYDPWLRVHVRNGGTIVKPCHTAMRIPGTVAEWEQWTGMRFFESGDYVVAGALTPVRIDTESDVGLYIEPNVWVIHESS
jgi:GNAT superfamily N-acetyltransferase